MSFDFKNKVVLITGASGNLGSVLALEFARAQAKIVLASQNVNSLVQLTSKLDAIKATYANNANLPSLEMVKQASVFDRVAIISEQVDYTMDVHNVMLQGLGDKIVMAEIFESGSTDLRNSIVKIINSQPDAIVLNPNAGITPKVLLNQLAEYSDELDEIQIISQLAYLGSDTREDAESLAEGMMIIDVPDIIDADFKEFKASIGSELQMHSDFLIASTHDAMLNLISFALKNDVDDPSFISNFANMKFQGFIADGKSFDKGSFLQGLKAGVFKIVDGNPVLQ